MYDLVISMPSVMINLKPSPQVNSFGFSMRRPEIDEAILFYVGSTWKKVAIVVVKVADECEVSFSDDEDDLEVVAQHIEFLVGEGHLLLQGNLIDWRHSEIRKP